MALCLDPNMSMTFAGAQFLVAQETYKELLTSAPTFKAIFRTWPQSPQHLIWMSTPWKGGTLPPDAQQAFHELCDQFCFNPVIQFPILNQRYHLITLQPGPGPAELNCRPHPGQCPGRMTFHSPHWLVTNSKGKRASLSAVGD
jgi:hypothetical protein